jgi:cysteine desulfurase/selenocysteine lyase
VVGLGAVLAHVERIGRANIAGYEQELLGYATWGAGDGLGPAPGRHGARQGGHPLVRLGWYRPEDAGSALDAEGIGVHAGHHGPFGQRS